LSGNMKTYGIVFFDQNGMMRFAVLEAITGTAVQHYAKTLYNAVRTFFIARVLTKSDGRRFVEWARGMAVPISVEEELNYAD
jgi:hypothetical protein